MEQHSGLMRDVCPQCKLSFKCPHKSLDVWSGSELVLHPLQLRSVGSVLQKAAPVLVRLNETTAAALREKEASCSARDQAVEERLQVRVPLDSSASFVSLSLFEPTCSHQTEEELKGTRLDLRAAEQQVGDLNLQLTILTSGQRMFTFLF